MDILALDFDGVICNSAGEACATGWKAATRLWPHRFKGDAPEEIIDGFVRVRPIMETGYESILLVRLLRDGWPVEKILADHAALFSSLMTDAGLSTDQWVHLFGQTRDAWMEEDLNGWIDAHSLYDGVVDALNRSDLPAYIISTKEKRFVLAQCTAAGLGIGETHVFGLESGKKVEVLSQLTRQNTGARLHFVEDRLETLTHIAMVANFDVGLYFAAWGYHTAADRDRADQADHIRVLALNQFSQFVRAPSLFEV